MFGLKRRSQDRETIIALRATHTAMRVAREVAYPELPDPENPNVFSNRRIMESEASPQVLNYFDQRRRVDFVGAHPWLSLLMVLASIVFPIALFLLFR